MHCHNYSLCNHHGQLLRLQCAHQTGHPAILLHPHTPLAPLCRCLSIILITYHTMCQYEVHCMQSYHAFAYKHPQMANLCSDGHKPGTNCRASPMPIERHAGEVRILSWMHQDSQNKLGTTACHSSVGPAHANHVTISIISSRMASWQQYQQRSQLCSKFKMRGQHIPVRLPFSAPQFSVLQILCSRIQFTFCTQNWQPSLIKLRN